MKTITIGRGPENMVTLDEPMTSRHHALLRCYLFGKMEIVDISQNGTTVNGMRIAGNKPYPLTRKDVVLFAHVEKLDWKRVPSPYRRIKYILMLIVALLTAIIIGVCFYSNRDTTSPTGTEDVPASPTVPLPRVNSVPDKEEEDVNKSDDRFVFPQTKKTNPKTKEKKKEEHKDTPKAQEQEKKEPSKPEEVQEQSVIL